MDDSLRVSLTEKAQSLCRVLVDGELVERAPWDPVGLAAELRTASIGPSTRCNACGVSPGQLHWPLCVNDWLPNGEPIVSAGVFIDDYFSGLGSVSTSLQSAGIQ